MRINYSGDIYFFLFIDIIVINADDVGDLDF